MNLFRSNARPSRVPTLTEVVDLVPIHEAAALEAGTDEAPAQETAGGPHRPGVPPNNPRTDVVPELAPAPQLPSHDELVRQVMADIQHQLDAMLEVRMKEALAPAITRFTDALARDTRAELGVVLKDVVARAVTQALTKHRAK